MTRLEFNSALPRPLKQLFFLVWAAFLTWNATGADADHTFTNGVATPMPSTRVHNLFRVTTNLFSGSAPESDLAFEEIAKLGVKTLLSVDGSKPDIETAHRHGLHYVHLPFGYAGVPPNRIAELTKAAQSVEGPIYVHCHHGLHRGPVGVAIICEATAGWTTNQAVAWLHQAGTAPDYAGLYRTTIEFKSPDQAAVARVGPLPEVTMPSSLVETMVAIDTEFTHLKAAQKAGWAKTPDQPDITTAHTATLLWEHFRELVRTGDTAKRLEDFRSKLAAAEKAADELRELLRVARSDAPTRDAAFQTLTKSCTACHKTHRD